jgi:hypothetical protein
MINNKVKEEERTKKKVNFAPFNLFTDLLELRFLAFPFHLMDYMTSQMSGSCGRRISSTCGHTLEQ